MAEPRRTVVSLATIMESSEFAPLKRELASWLEERFAEVLRPQRGRRQLTGLSALLDRQLKRLPVAERRHVEERFTSVRTTATPLVDRLRALSNVNIERPPADLLDSPVVGELLSPISRRVSFEFTSITCQKSTKEVGADEIYMTAFAGGPVGDPVMLGPRKLGDFRDGDRVTFSPPLATAPLPIEATEGFQTFLTAVCCAEVDNGEYLELMPTIYQELLEDGTIRFIHDQTGARAILKTLIGGEVMVALVGGVMTLVSPPVGIVIIVAAVAAIVTQVARMWRDDEMFTMQFEVLEFPVDPDHPPAPQTSSTRTLPLLGYGANYRLETRWRIR